MGRESMFLDNTEENNEYSNKICLGKTWRTDCFIDKTKCKHFAFLWK